MELNWPEIIKDISAAFKSTVGMGLSAFAGAWAAFLFQNRREDKKEKDHQYRALRFCHFAAMTQYQELITFRDRYLSSVKNDDSAWYQLPLLTTGFGSPGMNISELGFLLEGPDPDLLNRLNIGQQRYETVRKILELRNKVQEESQRRAAAAAANGMPLVGTEETLATILGRDIVAQLKDLTRGLYENNNDAVTLLGENLERITQFSSAQFPKRRAPKFEIIHQSTSGSDRHGHLLHSASFDATRPRGYDALTL